MRSQIQLARLSVVYLTFASFGNAISWRSRNTKMQINAVCTPPKFNMEPENQPLEKEIPIGNHHFQVPC